MRRPSMLAPHCNGVSCDAKLLADKLAQAVLDLGVAGNRRLAPRLWIDEEVVLLAVPMELATCLGQLSQQRAALQTATSIGLE